MNYHYQATQPVITFSHDVQINGLEEKDLKEYVIFSTSGNTGLQSYSYSRATKDLVGNFTITVKELPKGNFLDSVRPLDIVKIYESDSTLPNFIGVVNNISFGAIAGALSKIITISGKSIEYLFDMYKLSLDVTAMSLIQSTPLNTQFMSMLYAKRKETRTEQTTEKVRLSNPKTKDEALNNLVKAFQYRNLDMIKKSYSSDLVTAESALNKLEGAGFKKEYVIGILVNAYGTTTALLRAAGFKKVSQLSELGKKYKKEADELINVPMETKTVTVDVYNRVPIEITDCIKKLLGLMQGIMMSEKAQNIGTLAIYKLLEKYYGVKGEQTKIKIEDESNVTDFIQISHINIDCNLKYNYPISSNPFGNTTVKLFEYVKNLLPNNVYELFGVMENGTPRIRIREMPYGKIIDGKENYEEFLKLYKASYNIPASLITDYTLSLSNEQIYTSFMSYLEGSSMSSEQYLITNAKEGGYESAAIDKDKMSVYGYSLLRANFLGYQDDVKQEEDQKKTIAKKFEELNQKLRLWYGRLDEMYTGDITVVNVKGQKFPTIGEVLNLCGGYFYITAETHSWRYGDTPKINYKLDRGGFYTKDSFSRMTGISKQYAELNI